MSEFTSDQTGRKDLRLVGRTEDGIELNLVDQDGREYSLRISDSLRATINQPRLVAVPAPEAAATSVKEIQARLRAGQTPDELARTTEWELEKIEKFAGPIMQERAYIIGLAIETPLRRDPHAPSLAAATIAQLTPRGVDMTLVEWNTWRRDDGLWNIILFYPTSPVGAHNSSTGDGTPGEANWAFDATNRTLVSEDENARWISGEEKPSRPAAPSHGMIFGGEAPRLTSVRPEQSSPAPIQTAPATLISVAPVLETNEELDDQSSATVSDSATARTEDDDQEAKRDGVSRRIRIPSWDDIMFGGKKDAVPED